MAKVTCIAKQTLHGTYGLAAAGEKILLEERHAALLAAKDLLEIVGEGAEEEAKEKQEGSFRITDNTGAEKEKAEVETDPENPTGKEKKEPAGPKHTKRK